MRVDVRIASGDSVTDAGCGLGCPKWVYAASDADDDDLWKRSVETSGGA